MSSSNPADASANLGAPPSIAPNSAHPTPTNVNSTELTIRKHPVSFYGHPIPLPAPIWNTTSIYRVGNHIYVADKDGQTFSVTVNMARDFMSFHMMVAQTNSKTPSKERLERLNSICEPCGYRHFARLVNADPLIKDELVEITEGSAIKYPTYRDGYRPHFLRFDGEKQSEIDNALEIAALFSGSKDKAQEAIDLAFRVATTTFGGSKVAKTTNKGKGKPYEKKNRRNVKDRDGDVNMG